MNGHDVFLSFGGDDRVMAERIARELRNRGLSVFLDEDIRTGQGVTATIERALAASRVLLVYYSAGYPSRYACQFELTAALLTGQREGNPAGRIVVINPEPDEDHLFPVELADASFARAPRFGDSAAFAGLEATIRERLRSVQGTIGAPRFTDRPRWIADRVAGEHGFVGRYRELWQLHSRLREARYPMVRPVTSGPVVALLGVSGAGKSALAAAYAWQFGAAYPGGVHWLNVSGATRSDMTERYSNELRRVARTLRIGPGSDRAEATELTAAVSDHIFTARKPALWVVDDVPPDLGREGIEQLLLPAGLLLHTVLISRRGPYAEMMPTLELGPMSPEDARILLRRYRPVNTETEERTLDALVDRLGGHAMSLRLVGRQLRDRQGLRSVAEQVRHLADDPAALDSATGLIRDCLATLTEQQRLILQLTRVCAGASLPARFIADVVTSLRPAGDDPGDALTGLRELMLTTRLEDRWEFHAIVREAAKRYLDPVVPVSRLVRTAAERLLWQAALPGSVPDGLMPHAAVLARHDDVPADTAHALHRMLSVFHEERGEPVAAARHWELALSSGTPTAPDLLRTAQAHLNAGNFERAEHYAARAARAAAPGSSEETCGVGVLAQALDSLGRTREADPHWDTVRAVLPLPTDDRRTGARTTEVGPVTDQATSGLWLGYLKSRRLRGDMRTALKYAQALVAFLAGQPAETAGHSLQAARIEQAVIQLSTNAQREARQTAEEVQNWYRDHGLPEHVNAVTAQSLLAQAWLTLHLLELNPDPANWREAAESLARIREQLRSTHGPLHHLALSTDVEYGYALLCLGRPRKARMHLSETISRLDRRYGARHPLTLRARLMLGRSHAQLREYEQSAELHEHAYNGLTASLGPRHPDTLHAQYGLGVALVLTGSQRRGWRMLSEVRRMAPSSVGRKSDLYAQSLAATVLFTLPSGLWRGVDRMTNDRPRHDDEP
ncbi:tetratricopeptide repeat protein [Streptomyces sp. SP17KL33]|uniref:tetratricopeptide repeat protein n=1 Tax=Streptomyces sp. SP17KL33 TaxID=3002534 RepID=UPI002E7A4C63|nr:toll/interleukin-1 receptor domain-containing protein [Streptomyces sp. SP17KL33]MEE1830902.1 toll/interleukin-1 receptor domain-containing protein [Streptomyces sp. SP17KL33]